MTASGTRVQDIVTTPQRALDNITRAVRTCSRSGVTAVGAPSSLEVHSSSAALIRDAIAGAALVHPSTRWAWTVPYLAGTVRAVVVFGQ